MYWIPFSLWRGCRGIVPATTVFCLVAREVCLALDVFDEGLATSQKSLHKAGYIPLCSSSSGVDFGGDDSEGNFNKSSHDLAQSGLHRIFFIGFPK